MPKVRARALGRSGASEMATAPQIAIRVDASAAMGTGHLKRCLSLVQALSEAGAQAVLVCRALDSVAAQILAKTNMAVRWLPAAPTSFTADPDAPPQAVWAGVPQTQDAQETVAILGGARLDWVAVDHYAFDARWHQVVRDALGCRLLVIDDTADRALDADALLDHNWVADHRAKYAHRLQREPLWLCGPRFAMLAPAYRMAPRYGFHEKVRSIGIFMGGTDPGSVSACALAACRAAGFSGPLEVVSTSANPHLDELRRICHADPAATLTVDEPDLARFFARHDLQIGAGGGATWERCCIGVPSVIVAFASNQKGIVDAMGSLGVAVGSSPDALHLAHSVHALIEQPELRRDMAVSSRELVDGFGALRVALALLGSRVLLAPAELSDAELAFTWRNATMTRRFFRDPRELTLVEHKAWWRQTLSRKDRRLLIAQIGRVKVGVLRLDWETELQQAEVSIYLDPKHAGLGLGKYMLRTLSHWVRASASDLRRLVAEVTPDNLASRRAFESAGYHRLDDRHWRLELDN